VLLRLLFIAGIAARPSSRSNSPFIVLACYVAMGHSCGHHNAHLLCKTDGHCVAHIFIALSASRSINIDSRGNPRFFLSIVTTCKLLWQVASTS